MKQFTLFCLLLIPLFTVPFKANQERIGIEDWLHNMPAEYSFLEGSALDSLMQFGSYLDPEGNSEERVKYEYRAQDNTTQISLSFATGQAGFSLIQIKIIDDQHLLAGKYSGTPYTAQIQEFDLFKIIDGKLVKEEKNSLSPAILKNKVLSLTHQEEQNGITGFDFFTDRINTFKCFYHSKVSDGTDKEFILEWSGSDFKIIEN